MSRAQRSLFDAEHGIAGRRRAGPHRLHARFVAPAWRRRGSPSCAQAVEWKAERRRMYDRDVDVPRLTAHFHLVPDAPAADAVPAADPGGRAARHHEHGRAVQQRRAEPVPRRPGQRGPAQRPPERARRGHPIALLSLGATRRMTIRAKEPPRRALQVDLEGGSLLMMSYATQLHYTHGVPKTAAGGRGADQPGLPREAGARPVRGRGQRSVPLMAHIPLDEPPTPSPDDRPQTGRRIFSRNALKRGSFSIS